LVEQPLGTSTSIDFMASSFLLFQKSTSMFLQWERGVVVDFIGEMQHAVGRVQIWSGKSGSCEG
jgi:hypothetical protein